jgi:IS30 family transposase
MRSYSQLTEEQRYQIYEARTLGLSQTEIAESLGIHKSTVSRELKRNSGLRGYRPRQAHQLAENRKAQCTKRKLIGQPSN